MLTHESIMHFDLPRDFPRSPRRLRDLRCGLVCAIFCSLGAVSAQAQNVDLSTVPDRETVQLTIYNSEDLTLVRETRQVSFKQGINPLQFSWANTLIDPTSVELRFLTHADQLDVLDTTYPHDKPQMLYWNVQSDFAGEATLVLTYFTSGISWSADYLGIANPAEDRLAFEGFVRVTNNSGEEYEDAQVRLVVGTINLVEKIAQLAQIPMHEVERLSQVEHDEYFKDAAKGAMMFGGGRGGALGGEMAEAKQIIKEGLSEYFIYTIEGTESIPNGWSKRLRSLESAAVPLEIVYRYRPEEYGEGLMRLYLWKNDVPSGLGTTPLPDGVVRVFRDNGRDGLSYLGAQNIKYVPIGDKIELNLGVDPQVVFELLKRQTWRDNLWVQVLGQNVFRRVDDGNAQIEEQSVIAGWNDHGVFVQRVRNYTPRAIKVEIRRAFGGHAVFRSTLAAKNHDYRTVESTADVAANSLADLAYEVLQLQGHNAKQENVTVEQGPPRGPRE